MVIGTDDATTFGEIVKELALPLIREHWDREYDSEDHCLNGHYLQYSLDEEIFNAIFIHGTVWGYQLIPLAPFYQCYGDNAPSETTTFAEFKRVCRDTDDAERSGCPNEAVTPDWLYNAKNCHNSAAQ